MLFSQPTPAFLSLSSRVNEQGHTTFTSVSPGADQKWQGFLEALACSPHLALHLVISSFPAHSAVAAIVTLRSQLQSLPGVWAGPHLCFLDSWCSLEKVAAALAAWGMEPNIYNIYKL